MFLNSKLVAAAAIVTFYSFLLLDEGDYNDSNYILVYTLFGMLRK